tara:strand:- start:27414 stop:29102 length:1689 start_codon:yes stop_codon:yes gene_type:complete
MAEQLYFSRDSKLYIEFDPGSSGAVWEIPVLDGFSFSQSTNQSEISLSEMQGADGLSRRGNRVFTDSLAPAEWSFSTYVRPYQDGASPNEHHAVEEALWAVMAGADKYTASTASGALDPADLTCLTVGGSVSGATNGVYTINDATSGLLYGGSGGTSGGAGSAAVGWEIEVTIASGTTATVTKIDSGGTGFSNGDIINIPATIFGGTGGPITLTVVGAKLITTGASFYRNSQPDPNSTHGPAVVVNNPVSGNNGAAINFGQSNRSTLATCNLYFVMETSTANPMVYKLEAAAFNEASIDFEVDGIATINWSGFAAQVRDLTSDSKVSTGTAARSGTGTAGHIYLETDNDMKFSIYSATEAAITAGTTGVSAVDAIDTGTTSTKAFIRNRLTQLLISTTGSGVGTTFPNGVITGTGSSTKSSYSLTLTGGNITISNNISYLVPEELGTVNVPIEHVTGGRTASGSFTCYLTFDDAAQGTSVDLFNDMTRTGLNEVVNDFDVTFQVGGSVANTPRLNVNMPKVHVNVPAHSIEDVISVETSFASYTDEFNVANEVNLEYFGVAL